MANQVFRLLSLRHSKRSTNEPAAGADARLSYGPVLDAQANPTRAPGDQALRELKRRYLQVAEKLTQYEKVQSAIVNAYMSVRAASPVPVPAASLPDHHVARRATPEAAHGELPPAVVVSGESFLKKVESRLDEKHAALFRGVIEAVPRGSRDEIGDLTELFEIHDLLGEGNRLCTQVHAVESSIGEGWPTVSGEALSSSIPIVAAVGWGELVVAQESLVGYRAREIAHIENILPGETKFREHQRIAKTEEVQETETTTEKETEKDSQTTDRYELQAQSQEVIARNFSVAAGVNVSGKYGMMQVDASLDSAFSQSQTQSRSNSIDTAKEVVSKAVERTFERVRVLRRLVLTEEIHELNRHDLTNAGGSTAPKSVSGIYLWVEKIQKVELRHYGTRMMVEFHVPEPALSLLEQAAAGAAQKTFPPFDVSPGEIQPGNYMCLAERYGALDVETPPTLYVQVGWGWTSTINEDAEAWGEDQFSATINIPAGYRPVWAKVGWSGLVGKQENRGFNFAFAIGGKSQGIEHTVNTYDGVVLQLDADSDWPQGVPVSGRVHGAWDGAMYVQATLKCMRTAEALDAWRLRTWQALRAGYEALERKAAQAEQQQTYRESFTAPEAGARPASENRSIERGELQKWAIKSMRRVPQNFNAVEQVAGLQEVSPHHAEAQAPVVRFYENAFEWEHMNYFLYPYHWARRASWRTRAAAASNDPLHQSFLKAGAARVIVPVTPGYEAKVAWFLDPSNTTASELERILTPPPGTAPPSASDSFRDLWIELLTTQKPDLARGSGTLQVKQGNASVLINPDSNWSVSESRDLGREVYIAGERYEVTGVTNDHEFTLDRPYAGVNDPAAVYVAGSAPFGPPWTVNVPTSLVVLADNVPALESVGHG
jgi:hypothetical protein